MADKISTLILKVDLECRLCYKKIRKTLCKLQDRERILSIAYDEKKGTVTVSGPFDPNKLRKKLCCEACKVIKEIQILDTSEKKEKPKENPKPQAEPVKTDKPKAAAEPAKTDKPKAEPAKSDKPKAEPAKSDKPKEKPSAEPSKPEKAKPAAEKEKPSQPNPQPAAAAFTQGMIPVYSSSWPAGPVCGCGPVYEAHYGGCRCCACGQMYGWVAAGPPGEGSKACQFFSEEDPTSQCSVM